MIMENVRLSAVLKLKLHALKIRVLYTIEKSISQIKFGALCIPPDNLSCKIFLIDILFCIWNICSVCSNVLIAIWIW